MKVTIHCEGTREQIAGQLLEAVAIYNGSPGAESLAKRKKAAKVEEEAEEEEADESDDEETEADSDEEADDEEDLEVEEDEDADEEEAPAKGKKNGASKLTVEDMTKKFQAYAKRTSRDKALKVLKQFKVKSVSQLKPAQYADVLAIIDKK